METYKPVGIDEEFLKLKYVPKHIFHLDQLPSNLNDLDEELYLRLRNGLAYSLLKESMLLRSRPLRNLRRFRSTFCEEVAKPVLMAYYPYEKEFEHLEKMTRGEDEDYLVVQMDKYLEDYSMWFAKVVIV